MTEKLDIVVKACEDKIGEDIRVIDISQRSGFADYFVIVTGNGALHTQALANEIQDKIEEEGHEILGKEGFREGSWILLDLGEIIVHVFTNEQREFYNLENIWD